MGYHAPRHMFIGATRLIEEVVDSERLNKSEGQVPVIDLDDDWTLPPILEAFEDANRLMRRGIPAEIIHYIVPGDFPHELAGGWTPDRMKWALCDEKSGWPSPSVPATQFSLREMGRRMYLRYYTHQLWQEEGIRELCLHVTAFAELLTKREGRFPVVLSMTHNEMVERVAVISTNVKSGVLASVSKQIARGEPAAFVEIIEKGLEKVDPSLGSLTPGMWLHGCKGAWALYDPDMHQEDVEAYMQRGEQPPPIWCPASTWDKAPLVDANKEKNAGPTQDRQHPGGRQ